MKKVFLIVAFGFACFISANGQETNGNPVAVVELFYKVLFSNMAAKKCPSIFYEPQALTKALPMKYRTNQIGDSKGSLSMPYKTNSAMASNAVTVVWRFFRAHKRAFAFGNPIKHIRYKYMFHYHPNGAPFFEGGFLIVAMGLPKPHDKSGMFKEVAFPMCKASDTFYGVHYLIDPSAITVNGAFLDYGKHYDRSEDLWKKLGLK